ncbi:unnamed protein product, partial [Didymodactylos carnosus]
MATSTVSQPTSTLRIAEDITRFRNVHNSPDDLESMTGTISNLQQQAQEVMKTKPTWQTYYQGQMIGKEDFEFISQYDQLNSEQRAKLLQ